MSRWALVTGAARRIGSVIALELAQAGWDIVVHYHTARREAETLAHRIEKLGQRAALAEIDLANPALAKNLVPQLAQNLGGLEALVNNAALFEPDASDPDGARHMAVNTEAPRLLSEAFFVLGTEGAIVNMLDAHPDIPGFASYAASKRALADLTLDLARRFEPKLRVNGVALGPTLRGVRETEEHFARLVAAAGGRANTPEDAARAVRTLIEDRTATGKIIQLDSQLYIEIAS